MFHDEHLRLTKACWCLESFGISEKYWMVNVGVLWKMQLLDGNC